MESTSESIGSYTAGGNKCLEAIGWGLYVACAWTWCIGMFLPVLLVHDFGLGGWVLFAIPNVLGAGAMGWVLAKPGLSEKLVQSHRPACVAFTAVTLAFHLYFLFWMSTEGVVPTWAGVTAVGVGTGIALIARRQNRLDLWLATGVFAVSACVLIRGLLSASVPDLQGSQSPVLLNALSLTPVCAFGFLLCPYLDLTFHRAVRETASYGRSRLAFGVGFGVFFFAMILLTLLYEGDFNRGTPGARLGSFGAVGLVTWVATHMAVQTGFTWTSHLRALPRAKRSDVWIWIAAAGCAAVGIYMVAARPRFDGLGTRMLTGEVVYRAFMGFYGLVFPAYVWICMVPRKRAGRREAASVPERAALISWGIAVLLALPLFWIAFVDRHDVWLLPGLAILLLARYGTGVPRRMFAAPGSSLTA